MQIFKEKLRKTSVALNRQSLWQLLALVALLLGPAAPGAWAQCEKLVWQDEFNNPAIDRSKWELEVNGTGQGTGQLDFATDRPQNASIVNGNLVLNILKEEYGGLHYTSARLRTYKKVDFQYGRIEARLKGVYSQGNGFAFWMLGSDYETVAWPKCGEVDIFENTGRLPGHNIGTAHYQEGYGHAYNQGAYDLPTGQRWADAYHVVGIEWSPTYIKWSIDGQVYHTMDLTNPINGYRPFNRPFFLLLSVGMGGDYSGPPDATTVNPMSATIDWVHVYKGTYSTFVSGDNQIYKGEQNKQYSVTTTDDATNTYVWTVPAGARILSGQGTKTINVDWGQAGGNVSVQVTSSCNSPAATYTLGVTAEEPFVADKVFENFEVPPALTYTTVSGTFTKGAPNPLVNSVNPSPKVGKYIRNAGAQYDVLGMQNVNATPAGDFVLGKRRILLDVYTDAPPGTKVSLNFENSRVANAGNYPSGRYANFEAVTSKQGQWETLEFAFTGTPDQYAGASDVDQWILLFAPVTYTGNVFYFDNLRTGQPGGPPRTLDTNVLQNFDGVSLLTKDFSNGTYAVQANPSKVAPNTSNTVAKYVRDAGTSYDALVYLTTAIADARPFRLGNSKLSMDVYTDAPVGTKLSLNFEISTISLPGNFPSGRYASFEAVTTRQNQWETVTFSLSSIPDAGASDAAVDKLVFLLNPVSNTGNTYYIDNLRINSTAPKENLVLAGTWEDYDANRNLTLNYATGTYTPLAANPAPAGVNTSAHVAQYVRNPAEQYDRIIFNKNTAAINPTALKQRTQKIAIDVYTSAPAGTPISVGLDATSLETASNYPTGRHSNYQSVTTVQNAWHTVYFTLSGQPDASTPDNLVDSFAILFESGRTTNTTYYFDNIRVLNVVPQPTLTTLVVTPALTQNLAVGATQQYTAQGKDQFGNNIAAPGVTWTVSGGGSISASGLFTASANGAFKVTASSSGLLGKADVLVGQGLRLTTLSVDPIATFVYQGSTLALTARGLDQTGAPATFTPTWAVSGATGVSISSSGVLTATSTASGTAAVVVSSGTTLATATITVRTPPVADSISVSPTKVKVYQGDALQFAANALDQYRNPITATYTWSVSGGGTIDATGLFTSSTIGTFVVKAQAGAAVASTYVSVVPKPANLALNRPTRASSTQGTLRASYATDGTTGRTVPDTRWASASTDTEWIRVDLGQNYDLSRVVLYWEAAYGKIYDIQVANDTLQTRRLAYHEPNGDGNVDDLNLAAGTYGRYVWMSGTLRGSPYGYSLFEMQVFGLLRQNPVLKSIIVTPNFSSVATSTSVAFVAAGFDQFGNSSAITPTWTTSGGTINGATGAFSAATAGSYTITATAGGVSGTASITVTGGTSPVSPNLALNKPARASSVGNAGNPARNAVDGNATGTRWESVLADPQWLRVDLGATYTLNRVKLTWETALGKDYVVQISADTVNWTPLKTVTGNTALVNDWTGLAGTGRYLRIYGTARGTGWGYSIYELEAYGTGGSGGNQVPTVAITAPAKNATFTGLAPVTITATAADADGSVAKVEFYAGTMLVSTDTSAPYSATWTPAAPGAYALTAKAYNNLTAATTSAAVNVTVNAASGGLIIPGRIEAESYTTMSGVATEGTSDTGGGQNVGYIDTGDWLDYAVNVQTAGTYTVQFRVAGFAANAQLQLKAGSTVLAAVAVPNTGGSQVWTTVSATAALPAGNQTLRVAITGGGFNFNWIDFARTGARGTATATAEQINPAGPLGVYPNPVANTFTLTGIVSFPAMVGVYDARGAQVKQVLLQELGETTTIDVSGLSKGLYLIRTTSPRTVQTQHFVKE